MPRIVRPDAVSSWRREPATDPRTGVRRGHTPADFRSPPRSPDGPRETVELVDEVGQHRSGSTPTSVQSDEAHTSTPPGAGSFHDPARDRLIQSITRPDPALMTYYILVAVAIPPLFPFLGTYLYFRYHTMRYSFTDDGISMSWGILFRREVIVNYARIQDIHLQSNVVERWLGLARILVQTASGSSSAEMTIEGIKQFESLRDFLYARTRGVKDHHAHPAAPAQASSAISGAATTNASPDELAVTLREVAGELRAIRELLEKRKPNLPEEPRHV